MSPENIRTTYDVIVIGAGHNGLVAAAYLAKAGRKVLVLEKREIVGGAAVTEELFPGVKISSLADDAGYFSSKVIDDLQLKKFGLEILHRTPLIFSPQLAGHHLVIWQDIKRTAEEINKFSTADGEAYPKFIEAMSKFSRIISELNDITPPDLPDVGLGDMFGFRKIVKPMSKLGWKNIDQFIRFIPLSLSDLLSEWFESEKVKAAIGASALLNISLGPQESGSAYTFLYNWSCSNNGLFRANGQVEGGMGSLTEAIAQAAKSLGVEILTGSEVSQIIVDGGRAKGVILANGDQISASTIVSATDMRTTFSKLVDNDFLDQPFIKHIQNVKYGGTTARVHFVLSRLPTFTSTNGDAQQYLGSHIQIAPSLTYIQKAYDPVKYGQFTQQPYLDIRIPTFNDPFLSPNGKQLMSVTVKYMPYHLRGGDWNKLREKLRDLVVDTITKYAPDFPQIVENSQVITPLDMGTTYLLPEGNPVHGDLTLDRFLWMRPIPGYSQYYTPVDGLYLCSAATHPGGGVTGINGKNAAGVILKKGL